MADPQGTPNDAMTGFPEHGDPADPSPPADPAPAPTPPSPPDPNADLKSRLDRLERENQDLRRLIPPPTPKGPVDPASDPIDEVDWDKELFADPKATIRKAINMATERTEKKLRAEYQRDTGTKAFWDKFYGMHPDLRQDHDLVEITLNSNIADLANIRVEDAYTRLADLTRQRILRYAGGAARTKPKARAEGAGAVPSTPPAPKDEPKKVTSLTDLIRSRRQNRRAGAA